MVNGIMKLGILSLNFPPSASYPISPNCSISSEIAVPTVAFIVHSLTYSLGPNVNGLEEPSLAKRLRGTPERIELENYRLSLQREEELEEVPEETLAEHNLSSVLDKGAEEDVPSRLVRLSISFLYPSQQIFAVAHSGFVGFFLTYCLPGCFF